MLMPVVDVRVVRVGVQKRLVGVLVGVSGGRGDARLVFMPVVFVVLVEVVVAHGRMGVEVAVPFREVQP